VADHLDVTMQAAVERLIGRPFDSGDRIGIAVSGGADSMALLALAAGCWPGQVEAATVDHGLRPEARAEAEMVANWCASAKVEHSTLQVETPICGNVQSSARARRYELLEDWRQRRSLDWLMTAHQADDQLETLLLRVNRGSGVAGLASIRSRRGLLLRPLLEVRRADLRQWCESNAVPFVDDPSNEDRRFDRVRMRHALASADLVDGAGLARSMEAIAEADAAIAWFVDRVEKEAVHYEGGEAILSSTEFPAEILRRLLVRMIDYVNPGSEKPRGPSIDQALVQLFAGKAVALADCVVAGGASWKVRRAPPRKSR
jgi:tRNA(Ile)-lysidine synthase